MYIANRSSLARLGVPRLDFYARWITLLHVKKTKDTKDIRRAARAAKARNRQTVAGFSYADGGNEDSPLSTAEREGSYAIADKDEISVLGQEGVSAGPDAAGDAGSTSGIDAAPRRVATKSSQPESPSRTLSRASRPSVFLPSPPPSDLPDSSTLEDMPTAKRKIAKSFLSAAAKTAYQIYQDLGNARSVEMVADRGGFELEDVRKWYEENHWEEQYLADQREVANISLHEGNPVQAIRLRSTLKVDLQNVLERDIEDPQHYGIREVDRKAIFAMIKELTDTEIGADKMRPDKIIILMDREAYERASEPRSQQIKEQKDDKLYEEMHTQAVAQAEEQKELSKSAPEPVHVVIAPAGQDDPFKS